MKTRILHTKIYSDDFFVNLTPIEKFLFIYYLTNENMNILHIYECPDRVVMFQTGINSQQLEVAKQKFAEAGKMFFYKSYVYVKNADKYEDYSGKNFEKAKETIKRQLGEDIINYFLSENRLVVNQSETGSKPDISNNTKLEVINNKSKDRGIVKGEIEELKKDEEYLQQIADDYKVPLSFVHSKLDDVDNWISEKPLRARGRDLKRTLRTWVKKDAMERRDNAKSKIAYVGDTL